MTDIIKGYLVTLDGDIAQEFGTYGDPLCQRIHHEKPIRLTCMELVKLVDELMTRPDVKENGKPV